MANRTFEMPQDLQYYLTHSNPRLLSRDQPQPDLAFEEIRTGSYYSTVFFPVSFDTKNIFQRPEKTPMMVLFIIPGGRGRLILKVSHAEFLQVLKMLIPAIKI